MNFSVTAISDRSITVAWEPPVDNPGDLDLAYNVYVSLDGGRNRFLVAEDISATNFTIMSESNWLCIRVVIGLFYRACEQEYEGSVC